MPTACFARTQRVAARWFRPRGAASRLHTSSAAPAPACPLPDPRLHAFAPLRFCRYEAVLSEGAATSNAGAKRATPYDSAQIEEHKCEVRPLRCPAVGPALLPCAQPCAALRLALLPCAQRCAALRLPRCARPLPQPSPPRPPLPPARASTWPPPRARSCATASARRRGPRPPTPPRPPATPPRPLLVRPAVATQLPAACVARGVAQARIRPSPGPRTDPCLRPPLRAAPQPLLASTPWSPPPPCSGGERG